MADKTVRYTPEFKRQMVALARSGRTAASLSKEFGPSAWTLGLWIKQAARDAGKGDGGLSSAERVVTTQSDPEAAKPMDLVQRRFFADTPDQLWVADLTYIPSWSGWLYLAMVMDVYSRKIVGTLNTALLFP